MNWGLKDEKRSRRQDLGDEECSQNMAKPQRQESDWRLQRTKLKPLGLEQRKRKVVGVWATISTNVTVNRDKSQESGTTGKGGHLHV